MNIVDYAIIGVLALSVVWGIYRGFLASVLKVVSFFISWAAAFLFYPAVAKFIQLHTGLVDTMLYFSEGADRIPKNFMDFTRMSVDLIPGDKLNEMIVGSQFPKSIEVLLRENIVNQAFSGQGLSSLGDYFNYTLVYIIINVVSFLLVYIAVSLILGLIISMTNAVVRLPVLKQFDSLLGGCFGLIRGIFLVFVLFIIIPITLAVVPAGLDLGKYLQESALAPFFYQTNFITDVLRGVI